MINPEFKRNLWLSFSPLKLASMPLLLGVVFFATSLNAPAASVASTIHSVAIGMFALIVWIWGANNANLSFLDEVRNRTWDQQRMSALEPWAMTWGKLFGATALNWYGGALCLLAIATTGLIQHKPDILPTMGILCSLAVLLHAGMLATNLYVSQFGVRPIHASSAGWGLITLVIFKVFIESMLMVNKPASYMWWGFEIEYMQYWLLTSLLFAICFVFAAWRAMCSALQVNVLPWAWPSFALILTAYFGGQLVEENDQTLLALLLVGFAVSLALTYIALFTEANTLLLWRKLRLLQKSGEWRSFFEHLPLWVSTLLLSLVFAVLIYAFVPARLLGGPPPFPQPAHAFALLLMLLRDTCLVLFFAFSPNRKSAAGNTALCLAALDLLLPYLVMAAGHDELLFFLLPLLMFPGLERYTALGSILVMAFHVTVAIGLLNWRLRKASLPR